MLIQCCTVDQVRRCGFSVALWVKTVALWVMATALCLEVELHVELVEQWMKISIIGEEVIYTVIQKKCILGKYNGTVSHLQVKMYNAGLEMHHSSR